MTKRIKNPEHIRPLTAVLGLGVLAVGVYLWNQAQAQATVEELVRQQAAAANANASDGSGTVGITVQLPDGTIKRIL